ncbi:ANTAR domain-containing response regulator [Streptomonospora nanhaiensis]|uniref:ANTAR domain-containing response regulator n=1 Tax=Streptomonospora nanhaiensis TaxID=1323731 RepID=UPI001C386442|nr:ANTAR domain-containing protein [Streptomonospora nanhaiensis]MBV2364933.1 ANTAR domain-containing protein [Streptomonospora nanhaiensis]MBX9387244.1 ANTAR domain-containing protein [Streptomonospora nanhaiensis]
MWVDRLAREIGALGQAETATPERALDQMSAAAARAVPGCSAALVVIWRDVGAGGGAAEDTARAAGRHVVVDYGASHPDLATAFEHQYTTDEGPAVEAVREMRPVAVGDVLREDRWPAYTSMAVQCGDRASVTFPSELEGEVVTFGVHAVRPDAFDEAVVTPVVALLAEHAAAALHSAGRYTDVAREAAHMRRAITVRAVIDQAKGIIMHARGCDAAEAFEKLRRVAQRNRLKVADVARSLVAEHAQHAETGGR